MHRPPASARIAAALVALLAPAAFAQPPTSQPAVPQGVTPQGVTPDSGGQDAPPVNQLGTVPSSGEFNSDDHLFGGVGVRERLADRGIRLTGAAFADVLTVLDGPAERTEVRTLAVADVGLDTARLGAWDGGTAFARLYAGQATSGATAFPATLQEVDTVPAFDHVVLGELWYEQRLAEGRVRVRAGRMDANSDFAYAEYAATFATDSAAVTPTNYGIPSFLDPALGAVVFAYPGDWAFGAGVYRGSLALPSVAGNGRLRFFEVTLDGDRASTYALAEAGRRWSLPGGALPGQAKLGGWLADGEFQRFDGTTGGTITGGYLIVQQAIYDELDDAQGLGGFVQLGLTDETFSPIRSQAAAGLVYAGAVPGRDADRLGVYVSRAGLSGADGADFAADAEWVIEATYQIQVTPWLIVQPDVQHVLNAGGDRRDLTLGLLRVVLNF